MWWVGRRLAWSTSKASVRSCGGTVHRSRAAQAVDLLAERVRQASEPAHGHPNVEVLPFNVRLIGCPRHTERTSSRPRTGRAGVLCGNRMSAQRSRRGPRCQTGPPWARRYGSHAPILPRHPFDPRSDVHARGLRRNARCPQHTSPVSDHASGRGLANRTGDGDATTNRYSAADTYPAPDTHGHPAGHVHDLRRRAHLLAAPRYAGSGRR